MGSPFPSVTYRIFTPFESNTSSVARAAPAAKPYKTATVSTDWYFMIGVSQGVEQGSVATVNGGRIRRPNALRLCPIKDQTTNYHSAPSRFVCFLRNLRRPHNRPF